MALVLVLFQHQFFIMCCCEGVNEHENLNPSRGKYNERGREAERELLFWQLKWVAVRACVNHARRHPRQPWMVVFGLCASPLAFIFIKI
jgi:hypothetical protein